MGCDHLPLVVAMVPRQLAERLHVEDEIGWGAVGPQFKVARGLQIVERRIHLDHREVARVIRDALALHGSLVVFGWIEWLVVGPARGTDANVRSRHRSSAIPPLPKGRGGMAVSSLP